MTASGIDANLQCRHGMARTAGTATAPAPSSPSSGATSTSSSNASSSAAMMHVLSEVYAKDHVVLNSFESWWHKASDFVDTTRRAAWRGHLFGNFLETAIGCMVSDRASSHAIRLTYKFDPGSIPFPADHSAILT